ncbi:MAG: hypothetical protein F4227_10700 [Gammaproteobacteria bacterium]|nr:hypothetical protein [Gammaproteobacteria bacterium]MYF03402.1 hypothetical protein [Gammaproteobacteria bacterium]MYI77086.1 hypothetical protein [Gammaproteobacteria bacterium]
MSGNKVSRDDTIGFGLSFLDVLSCGLGASILLLLLLKHGVAEVASDSTRDVAARHTRVQQQLDDRLAEKAALEAELLVSQNQLREAVENREALTEQQKKSQQDLLEQLSALSQARSDLDAAKETVTDLQAQREAQRAVAEEAESVAGQTGQLGGIRVRSDGVVILLDRSASMLDHSLVEIVRLRAAHPHYRNTASKWVTARNTVGWAFKHVDIGNSFQVLTFSDTVTDMSGKEIATGARLTWLTRGDPGNTFREIQQTILKTEADGPTNLEAAFEAISTLDPKPKQVILITDGLPTVPGSVRLRSIRGCSSPARLSPECRGRIFDRAVKLFEREFPKTEISTILLPLEGDAGAMRKYWTFASDSGGRVLTPAPNWPPI